MTVKCLNQKAKVWLAAVYKVALRKPSDLAAMYGVSERTIRRVLVEQGVLRVRKTYTVTSINQPISTNNQLRLF